MEEIDNSVNENRQLNEKVSKLRELALTKRLNFLIGSGASLPGIPLMSDERFTKWTEPYQIPFFSDEEEEKEMEKNRNELLLRKVKEVSETLLGKDKVMSPETVQTLENYKGFLSVVINILVNCNNKLNI